jgi:hypothetical protein
MDYGLLQEGKILFINKLKIIFYRKDNVIYLWDTANLAKPVNKISFTDPLIQIAYNPCLFIVNLFKIFISFI